MSNIPNLNTLRRGGPRFRGSRRGGRAIPENDDDCLPSPAQQEAAKDRVVQQTDGDASSSRLSAVALGYLDDAYAQELLQPGDQIPRRYPIINRGTYVRTSAVDQLVQRFLEAAPSGRRQIISLGAGSDTRPLRLCCDAGDVLYHELDFETNIASKRAAFERSTLLSDRVRELGEKGCDCHLHAVDLRELASDHAPDLPHIDWSLPTLILSECCLCYLPPQEASSALQYFTSRLTNSVSLIVYEPIRPFDAFGKTMVSNLASRGIHMQTLKRYSSLQAQRERLRLAGFVDGQGARDVHQIWASNDWVAATERERVERLEWLDEVEEWKLLASHYCVAWGWKGELFDSAWAALEGGRTRDEDRDDVMD